MATLYGTDKSENKISSVPTHAGKIKCPKIRGDNRTLKFSRRKIMYL